MPSLSRWPCRLLPALLGLTSALVAQEPSPSTNSELEQRVRVLEATLQQMQTTSTDAAPADKQPTANPAEAKPVFAGWDKGFFIRSADDAYHLRITGQIQSDYREFVNSNDTLNPDTFLVRRARLGIEATVFEHFEFRLLPDFGQGQARIQDSYLNVRYVDWLQIEVGKFKQPFSYEQLIQDRFVPTLERSLIDQLVPGRDVGLMIHGEKLLDDRLDYAVAVSNGELNVDTDTNDEKDLNGRLVYRPFRGVEGWSFLDGLQLGISGGVGIEQEPVTPSPLRTPATVPWFQFNSTVLANGVRTRWSPELVYFNRSLGLAMQYFRQEQELSPGAGPAVVRVPIEGLYFLGTYLITGEERTTYSEAVVPRRNFDPRHPLSCPGAWELVARVSRLEVNSRVFAPGPLRLADPLASSPAATEMSLGFNWYLNAWVRLQFNWEHAWFDSNVRLGGLPFGHQDSLLTRFQVIF